KFCYQAQGGTSNCKASNSSSISSRGTGSEGTTLLHHGSFSKLGYLQFVFGIMEFVTKLSKYGTWKPAPPSYTAAFCSPRRQLNCNQKRGERGRSGEGGVRERWLYPSLKAKM
uniref:Uncharacterized protein n=1 Tax=Salvator merianae TaxID=96440 RepID=A0A8D0BMK7_SALMN